MLFAVLAHQGGWDEALLIATPLAALAGLLYLANRRANRRLNDATGATEDSPPDNADDAAASAVDS